MRTLKSVERRGCSCCLFIVLAALLGLALIVFLGYRIVDAGAPASDTVLAIDHSPSNFECDGIGTDPDLLRVQAARLFIAYQGAESGTAQHRLAILHFGGQVQPVAPLTDLGTAGARRSLIDAVERVEPIAWTDPALALDAADGLLAAGGRPGRQTVVLFTDGDPVPEPGRAGLSPYRDVMDQAVARLRDNDVSLIVVLLAAQDTSCGRRMTADWLDLWAGWTATTPGGALYTAQTAADLLPIYHAIARDLSGAQAGAPLARTLPLPGDAPIRVTAPVTQPLASMTLTVWKSAPAITVAILDPAGAAAAPGPRVTRAGEPGRDREEVWRISEPQLGDWQIVLDGAGRVSVWQDVLLPAPTPTATATPVAAPTATATVTPVATPAATPTATATATPVATATATPVATATAAAPVGSRDVRKGAVAAGGAAAAALVLGLTVTRRRPAAGLSGDLIPIAAPEGAAWPATLTLSGRSPIVIGRGAHAGWRLNPWEGSLALRPGHAATTVLAPVSGSAAVNDAPLRHPIALKDGDVIACGPYRIRYENLLQTC